MQRFVAMSLIVVLSCSVLSSCVPGDTRPPPAEVQVNVRSPAPPLWITEDGWTLTLDRFIVALGDAELGGDDCSGYQGGAYTRLFDLRSLETQKLSIVFGLGACEFEFRMRPMPGDAILGAGVTDAEARAMRAPGSDAYVQEKGTALRVEGRANREGREKRFAWSFRETQRFEGCVLTSDPLLGDQKRSITIVPRGEMLFATSSGALRFDGYADADTDGDGEITLAELDRAPLSGETFPTIGEELYRVRYPRTMMQPDGTSACSGEAGDRD